MKTRAKKIYSFLMHNKCKHLYLEALFLSAWHRLRILIIPPKRLEKTMGIVNQESVMEETPEHCRQSILISHIVNRVCSITPWHSKCLVRALTAQDILKRRKIPSTLYLGVGKQGDKMVAHAWLRSGSLYLTGGSGEGYAMVAKFRT